MFNGSENYDKDFFGPLEQAGATDMNGTTNEDRTNYFENVPTNALDLALWMESDRMGHLTGAISQPKLDEQRGVVQNEKRQGENEPYGKVWDFLTPKLYPANHPYSWTTIGSMEDLDAAKLDDVKDWFRTYYGAANAVVVVAGDIDAETARQKVEKYFGDIPAGPPVARQQAWVAKRTGSQRGIMQDRVPQARIYKVWNIPGWGTRRRRLSQPRQRRAEQRQVLPALQAAGLRRPDRDRRHRPRWIFGRSAACSSSRPPPDPASSWRRVEKAVDEELARFLAGGPTPAELRRVKTQYRAGFIRGVERIGGFGGKSDVLAQGEVFAGRPDFYQVRLDRIAGALPAQTPGLGQAVVERRRVQPRSAALSRIPGRQGRGRPLQATRARSAAGGQVPRAGAGHPVQRAQDRPGPPGRHPAGAIRPASGRGVRRGSVRHSRYRESGDGDAGRRDHSAHVASDQRPARAAGSQPRYRLQARCLQRLPGGAPRRTSIPRSTFTPT